MAKSARFSNPIPLPGGSLAGGVDSVSFTCVAARSTKCPAKGVVEWSCSEHCSEGKAECTFDMDNVGLNGTFPAAVGDLRCAGRIVSL